MPEAGGVNIEVAHHLSKAHKDESAEPSHLNRIVEILEALVLALVACATAWSGYQAALWGSEQSVLYGRSSKLRVQSSGLYLHSNQQARKHQTEEHRQYMNACTTVVGELSLTRAQR